MSRFYYWKYFFSTLYYSVAIVVGLLGKGGQGEKLLYSPPPPIHASAKKRALLNLAICWGGKVMQ